MKLFYLSLIPIAALLLMQTLQTSSASVYPAAQPTPAKISVPSGLRIPQSADVAAQLAAQQAAQQEEAKKLEAQSSSKKV